MIFSYLARNRQGELQTGRIEAANETVALNILQNRNLIVVKIRGEEEAPILSKKIKIFSRVKRKEIFIFFRQLAILIEANVPLVQSLKSLAEQIENHALSEIVFEVANDVDSGTLFSKALAKHPKVFSTFTINLIKAGEVAGRLQESLIYLADHLEREYYLISKVRGAMFYPAFILITFLGVGILIMVMVMPNLSQILLESGQALPLPTLALIATSNFVIGWGWLLLLVAVFIGLFIWQYLKTKPGRAQWDALKLKLPIFGKILQKTYLARFADNMDALIKGGVPILQALNISGQVVGNTVFEGIIFEARDEVKVGKNISSSLEKHKEFPPLFYQMVKTGEATGKLDVILSKLSSFYNKEVENVVNNLTQLLEPLLILVLGIGVTIMVFAVYMPIYSLAGAI